MRERITTYLALCTLAPERTAADAEGVCDLGLVAGVFL
jgi:hypothetical protein